MLSCLKIKQSKLKGNTTYLSWKLVHFKYGMVLFCNLPKKFANGPDLLERLRNSFAQQDKHAFDLVPGMTIAESLQK